MGLSIYRMFPKLTTQAKVANFNVAPGLVDEDISWLEISMNNFSLMTVV